MMNRPELITVIECAERLGMTPTYLRNEIIRKNTPFNAWAVKQKSGRVNYYIPRRSFENWMNGVNPTTDDEFLA